MTCAIESDGEEVFVVFNGVRIAKRGHRGTPQAKTWISLKPGFEVHGIKKIEVRVDWATVARDAREERSRPDERTN
jgi:hypothetical protein